MKLQLDKLPYSLRIGVRVCEEKNRTELAFKNQKEEEGLSNFNSLAPPVHQRLQRVMEDSTSTSAQTYFRWWAQRQLDRPPSQPGVAVSHVSGLETDSFVSV